MVQQVPSGPKRLGAEATLEKLCGSMGPHVGQGQRSVLEVQLAPLERTVNLDSQSAVYLDVLTASVLNQAFVGVFVALNNVVYLLLGSLLLLRKIGGL